MPACKQRLTIILANVGNLTNHVLGNVHADNLVRSSFRNGLNVSCLGCCSCVSYIIGDGLLSSGVILSYLSFLVITSGYTLIQDGVLGAVILQLVAADFVIVNNAVQNRAVVGREYTVNIVRSLEQNLNNTVGQSRVTLATLVKEET